MQIFSKLVVNFALISLKLCQIIVVLITLMWYIFITL
jgi:hypothetical protein